MKPFKYKKTDFDKIYGDDYSNNPYKCKPFAEGLIVDDIKVFPKSISPSPPLVDGMAISPSEAERRFRDKRDAQLRSVFS